MVHTKALVQMLRQESERKFREAEHLTTVANTLRDNAFELEHALDKDEDAATKNKSPTPADGVSHGSR